MSYHSRDLLYRLRMEATHGAGPFAALLFEAADAIEHLQRQLRDQQTSPDPRRTIRHDLPA